MWNLTSFGFRQVLHDFGTFTLFSFEMHIQAGPVPLSFEVAETSIRWR